MKSLTSIALNSIHMRSIDRDLSSHIDVQLAKAIIKVNALDQYRIRRALASNDAHFKHVFYLIPLLLHYNLPELPAYVENAPHGIYQFSFNHYQQRFFDTLIPEEKKTKVMHCAFDGIYSMGSTGSIVQTTKSDLDLWICHNDEMSSEDYQLIEQKLAKLTQWAKGLGIEVNFYLMNPERFKSNHYNCGVSEEHSGSAQHFFLLDEFYRSAVRLAGKRLLWLHLSDNDYKKAIKSKKIDLNEWIDFGDFSSLSTSEFFGASLWQLYKGIESPYKSAIKILLLESYAQTYPETKLISKQFKQKLLSNKTEYYHFDPYLAMLEQVTDYLKNRKELSRLDRLRQCFYLKAKEGKVLYNWRERELQSLIADWGWADEEIALLNSRPKWKMKQAIVQDKMLVEQLLQSYRNLINFANKFHINPSIMTNDTDILMRKLYSVFEILPGKVTLLNPHITPDLSEQNITFIEAQDSSAMKAGWYLINQSPKSAYDSSQRFVQYNKNLHKLVAWAYFNGMITVSTKLHVVSQHVDLHKLRQFITDLRLFFPVSAPKISENELLHPNEIRSLILAINLTNDPTQHFADIRRDFHSSDLFSFNAFEQNLVGSVSIIYRNMWNEIRTQHFEGEQAVLNALKLLSNKIYRNSAPPQSVNVFCYSKQFRSELRETIADLVHRCISVQTGSIYANAFNTVKVAGRTWQLVFSDKNVKIKPVAEQAVEKVKRLTILSHLSKKGENRVVVYPSQINDFASEGFLQFFFEDGKNGCFNVYILDENNHIENYTSCSGTKEEKIREINRLYAEQYLENDQNSIFNYPQFYQLLEESDEVKIVPFQSKQHREFMQKQG